MYFILLSRNHANLCEQEYEYEQDYEYVTKWNKARMSSSTRCLPSESIGPFIIIFHILSCNLIINNIHDL